jgi:hypothetical protein
MLYFEWLVRRVRVIAASFYYKNDILLPRVTVYAKKSKSIVTAVTDCAG